ncbi:hypothetical protein JPSP47_12500 [Staphylococcus pseudintermedius]
MDAELDFPDQLIPQESQPSGQSYMKYSETEGKFMKSRKPIASIFSMPFSITFRLF